MVTMSKHDPRHVVQRGRCGDGSEDGRLLSRSRSRSRSELVVVVVVVVVGWAGREREVLFRQEKFSLSLTLSSSNVQCRVGKIIFELAGTGIRVFCTPRYYVYLCT